MRFYFAVLADIKGAVDASANERAEIDVFNDKIARAGQRVMAVGIASPDSAQVFDNRGGRDLVTAGPAVDADVFTAGFWIIEADSESTAHDLAREASRACNRRIEVRPLL